MNRRKFTKLGFYGSLSVLGLASLFGCSGKDNQKSSVENIITPTNGKFDDNYFTKNGIKAYETAQKALKNISSERSIDLILSMINQESTFDMGANSKNKYFGYMQVSKDIAEKVGYKRNDVFDSQKNIEIGTSHLDELIKKYESDFSKDDALKITLFAYNVGHNGVEAYIQENKISTYAQLESKLKKDEKMPWFNRFKERKENIKWSKIKEGLDYVEEISTNMKIYNKKIENHNNGLMIKSRVVTEFNEERLYNPEYKKINGENQLVVKVLPGDTRWNLAKTYTDSISNMGDFVNDTLMLRAGQDVMIPSRLLKDFKIKKY